MTAVKKRVEFALDPDKKSHAHVLRVLELLKEDNDHTSLGGAALEILQVYCLEAEQELSLEGKRKRIRGEGKGGKVVASEIAPALPQPPTPTPFPLPAPTADVDPIPMWKARR